MDPKLGPNLALGWASRWAQIGSNFGPKKGPKLNYMNLTGISPMEGLGQGHVRHGNTIVYENKTKYDNLSILDS